MISLATVNNRPAAIRILGRNVLSSLGLRGLAIDTLTHSTSEISRIFTLLADRSAYPIHLFCQQGKDRTGLSVMLLLMLLLQRKGLDESTLIKAIEVDYMLSANELDVEPERTERHRELQDMALPEEFARCDSELVKAVDQWLKQNHGGIEKYLDSVGVGPKTQDKICDILLVK